MSEYRVGIVAEGPTDVELIQGILSNSFPEHSFMFDPLFPSPGELSKQKAETGGFGWGGVYRACGELHDRLEFACAAGDFDFLVIHLDGDVAYHSYKDAGIHDSPHDLPCSEKGDAVPSVCAKLERVLLNWVSVVCDMFPIVLCIPYISTETWAGALVFPEAWEEISEDCPEDIVYAKLLELGRPKAAKARRLVRQTSDGKIKKVTHTYKRIGEYITYVGWQSVICRYIQAKKFDSQLKNMVI
jgi:hypothetical protein